MQIPPFYSALKKEERLSTLIKKREAVEPKPARPAMVSSLTLTNFKPLFFCGSVGDIGKGRRKERADNHGLFTLEEHVLYEDNWTINKVARAPECCRLLLQM
ncbi:probable tRNA pseudouridine synthase 1 [Python bivittatus]|uniref:Probable tRNA pseudouridine synthase 1 n=1 Tax=Python bivittatus TaxID=176946 RepID=A0A9F5MUT7_PYTBI|nr:probable tRNA pseudouridine synthase 1 [Python bivittatus]